MGPDKAPKPDKEAKIDISHWDSGVGAFQLTSISAKQEQKHRDHGDGQIGDNVPAMAGFHFDEDCVSAPNILVRATSIDISGTERVIAQLEDTNGDDVPSTGDTAKFYEYPEDFTGTSYATPATSECVFNSDAIWVLGPDYYQVIGFGFDGSVFCTAEWYQNPTTHYDSFYQDSDNEASTAFQYSYFRERREVCAGCGYDRLDVSPTGPSLSRADANDDGWLNTEFSFTA